MDFVPKDVDAVARLGDAVLAVGVEETEHHKAYIEACVYYLFEGSKTARLP